MQVLMTRDSSKDDVLKVISHLNAMGLPASSSHDNDLRIVHAPDGGLEIMQSLRMMHGVDRVVRGKKPLEDANIAEVILLDPPKLYQKRVPLIPEAEELVSRSRYEFEKILTGEDKRLVVITGPCSIHDTAAGLEYAKRLSALIREGNLHERLLVIMRAYFEKPRTTVGWEGLIGDPHMDESFDMAYGILKAREFLSGVLRVGVPVATEFMDTITAQYIDHFITWAAIGARSAEAAPFRRLASGLSMPVGFKNGTGGSIQVAVNAMIGASVPHVFPGIDKETGRAVVVKTLGHHCSHLVLRGGSNGPNYDEKSIREAMSLLEQAKMNPCLLVDCSHDNSGKDHRMQSKVFRDVLGQRIRGNSAIIGMALESNLKPGKQKLDTKKPTKLDPGTSVTDECIGWDETQELLLEAYKAMGDR